MRPASDYTTDRDQAELKHNSHKCSDIQREELLAHAALHSDDEDMLNSIVEEIQNDGLLHKLVEDCILSLKEPKVSKELYQRILDETVKYWKKRF